MPVGGLKNVHTPRNCIVSLQPALDQRILMEQAVQIQARTPEFLEVMWEIQFEI